MGVIYMIYDPFVEKQENDLSSILFSSPSKENQEILRTLRI